MSDERFMALLPIITAELIDRISEKYELAENQTIEKLYSSKLYESLEREETKVWQYSTVMLMDLFKEEIETGKIVYPEC